MKIALLSYEYPPDTGFGGIGTYTWCQARALVRLGHEVRVVAGSLEPGMFESEHDGVQVTRVNDPDPLEGAIDAFVAQGLGWAPNRLRAATSAYRALQRLLEHESYDMVEYTECGADAMIAATMLPIRRCVRFHSPARLIMESYGASEQDREITAFLEQIAINRAGLRIASSRFLAAEVVARMDVPPPVHVVPSGIDLDLVDRSEGIDVVERFGLPRDAITILFTSRLERRKGIYLLPAICAQILGRFPQVHFVFAGEDTEGAFTTAIQPAADAVGAAHRVRALGRVSLTEVRALLRHADVHLLPTLWDNAPYACIEAMASATAVVSSDFGGLPELVEHGRSGLLARTGDAASFVTAIECLVEDRELRERLGAGARARIEEHFTDVGVAQQTVDLWRRAIASGQMD
jgi:glycosyltransferase involved in cell wall biosynthesis